MAVVVVNEIEGGSQDFYDQVNPKVMPDGQLPEGCQAHIAGPSGGGWRVITVWESREAFDRFREQKLLPAIQELAGGQAPPVAEPEVNPVHKLVTR